MARWLKQSTSVDLPIGPFLDSTDGITPETALTITQPDIRLKKNGGAWAQKAAAQTLSHEEAGWYEVTLDATDTDTLGQLMLACGESGAVPIWHEFMVVPANVWDSFFGADALQVHANEITAGLITAAAIATGAVDADALATDAVTEIQAGLATSTALTTIDDFLDTEIAAIKAKTDQLTFTVAGLVDSNTEAMNGDITVPPKMESLFDNEITGTATSGTTTTLISTALVGYGTNLLRGCRVGFNSAPNGPCQRWITANVTATGQITFEPALDNAVANGHTFYIEGDTVVNMRYINGVAQVATLDTIKAETAAIQADTNDLQSRVPATLTAGGNVRAEAMVMNQAALADFFDTNSGTTYAAAVAGSVVKEIADSAGGAFLTLPAIADAVWNETLTGHSGANSAGAALTAAGTAGDPWITPVPGAYPVGSAGHKVGNTLDAAVSSRMAAGAQVEISPAGVDSILDEIIEGAITLRESIRLLNAESGGKTSGGGTTTNVFRDLADTKARITAIVDALGNRTSVTRDLS